MGLAVVLGEDSSPNETFIQVASRGFLITTTQLRSAMFASSSLHLSFCRYAHDFLIHTSRTALVNSRAKIEERLARWLLLVHDRTDENTLNLTHEFLSTMLGVRRPGVTLALHMLEYRGLIRAKRSEIVIIDRDGLVALTQGLYGPEEQRLRTHFPFVLSGARTSEKQLPATSLGYAEMSENGWTDAARRLHPEKGSYI